MLVFVRVQMGVAPSPGGTVTSNVAHVPPDCSLVTRNRNMQPTVQ